MQYNGDKTSWGALLEGCTQEQNAQNPPWKEHSGQPGDIPTSELVSLSVSLCGYFLSNTGDQPDEYPGSKPTGNLVRGHIERKREALNCVSVYLLNDETKTGKYVDRRSVLEYVQYGHATGQHWTVWSILMCGVLLTSQGY